MNKVFTALSIGLQCTLSFKRPDFALKYLVTITPDVQSLKFKANVWMKQANCSLLGELIDSNWVIIMEQEKKNHLGFRTLSLA